LIGHRGEELGVGDFDLGGSRADLLVDAVNGDGGDLGLDLGGGVGIDARVELAESVGIG
jgi:hypothetical protein